MSVRRALSGLAVAIVILAACSDDPSPRSEAAYCGQVAAHVADLNSPPISTSSDIGRVLTAWRSVAAAAPVAVDTEWATMVESIETAITVDPNDPESLQRVADTARASEPAAEHVVSYTQERCGITIGLAP